MSENDWKRVRMVHIQWGGGILWTLTYLEHDDAGAKEAYVTLGKPAQTLYQVEPGSIVEVIFDYKGWIVDVRRITGTLRGRVEALEQALKAAGIPIPPNALEKP